MVSINVAEGLAEIPESLVNFERDQAQKLEQALFIIGFVLPLGCLVCRLSEVTLGV